MRCKQYFYNNLKNLLQSFKIYLLFTNFLALPLLKIHAQRTSDFITYETRSNIGFSTEQTVKLNRIISNPIYSGHYYIKLEELPTFHFDASGGGSNLTLRLPSSFVRFINPNSLDIDGDGTFNQTDSDPYDPCIPNNSNNNCISLKPSLFVNYTFEPIKILTYSNTEYEYHGEWNPCDENNTGYISIIAKNGNLFGEIRINEHIYEIIDLGGRKNILLKLDNDIIQTYAENNDIDFINNNRNYKTQSGYRDACNVIDVLILYTDLAEKNSTPIDKATLFISEANLISSNSKTGIFYRLVGVQKLVNFSEVGSDLSTKLRNLQGDPEAQNLRNAFNADLVSLFVDQPNDGAAFAFVGPNDPDFGYSIIDIVGSGGGQTFAHELAHNFGCLHEDETGNARAKQFHNGCLGFGKKSKTIVSRGSAEGIRINHISNPDVSFKCRATGSSDRNNANQASSSKCIVANFRQSQPKLSAEISGPVFGIPGNQYTYCVSINNCPNAITINWEYSLNGFHYTPSLQNSTCITLPMPLHGSIYIRVRVNCEGVGTVTEFWETYNEKENPKFNGCNWGESSITNNGNNQIYRINDFKVFPNPTEGELLIEFDVTKQTNIKFSLYDKLGKEIKILLNQNFNEGSYIYSFDISGIYESVYFIQKLEGGDIISKQIIKI